MRIRTTAVLATIALGLAPAAAIAQTSEDRQRFNVKAAAGPTIIGGGYSASAGLGFAPNSHLEIVVNVERVHMPFELRQYSDGYSTTRGGDLTFASGELRASFLPSHRTSPFVMIGAGGGISRPTVNDYYPNVVKNNMRTVYVGGGVRVPLKNNLTITGDARAMLALEGYDSVLGIWPVRAGVEWRF